MFVEQPLALPGSAKNVLLWSIRHKDFHLFSVFRQACATHPGF